MGYDLVIFDLCGTILHDIRNVTPRNGFYNFLERYKRANMALATDAMPSEASIALKKLDVRHKFYPRIYTLDELVLGDDNRGHKDFRRILRECNAKEAVFITDGSGTDLEDAEKAELRCIHIPYFYDDEEKFSFDMLDLEKDLPMYLDLREINK